jgi:aerobic-type carbon monoxide dehydrogenase small subunit (CoxS/CutS family)
MNSIRFVVNGEDISVDVAPEKPLLWVLREDLKLTGTKYGCGIAMCGCCTVHLDGDAVRSCVTPVLRAEGRKVTTIEGLSENLSHPVQQAWVAEQVPQCGYCQAGQMMSAACLLSQKVDPSDAEIDDGMSGNLCRCGTYHRIRAAIHRAARIATKGDRK